MNVDEQELDIYENRLLDEYWYGLLAFIEVAKNRLERNWVEDKHGNIKKIFVFETRYHPIGKMTPIILENYLWNKAKWYILQNYLEIQQYIE